jgi:hypothetical protein
MLDINGLIGRAAEKSGLSRTRFKEKNLPTSIESIVVLPFFGDHRSSFVLSSLLLRRIKEELKGSKYFVLASWPGHEGLFPYVDEYWHVSDESALERLVAEASGFSNSSPVMSLISRNLNQYFYEVMDSSDLLPYYENGLKKDFFERFKHVKLSLPSIPSSASIGMEVARTLGQKDRKIFVYPSKEMFSWRFGGVSKIKAPRAFWGELLGRLESRGFFPVVCSDSFSHDLSSEFSEGFLHFKNLEASKMLGLMRACGCVLDVFSGISRFSIAARTPFVCFDERARFNGVKEYEINDLCGRGVPKEYIFGFGAIIESGDKSAWNSNIFEHIFVKLEKVYGNMDKESWPSSVESNEIVPYESVRRIKNKKFGSRFIRIQKD